MDLLKLLFKQAENHLIFPRWQSVSLHANTLANWCGAMCAWRTIKSASYVSLIWMKSSKRRLSRSFWVSNKADLADWDGWVLILDVYNTMKRFMLQFPALNSLLFNLVTQTNTGFRLHTVLFFIGRRHSDNEEGSKIYATSSWHMIVE